MRVLIVDPAAGIYDSIKRPLEIRGHEVTCVLGVEQAALLLKAADFDWIFIQADAPEAATIDLLQIRHFAMFSGVALLTSIPIRSMIDAALADGSIEILSAPVTAEIVAGMGQPALLVSTDSPALAQMLQREGRRTSVATTLRFAMNLLVDGWCQAVLFETNIPGLFPPRPLGSVAAFHSTNAPQLAILASAMEDDLSGIIYSPKPQTAAEMLALMRRCEDNRPSHCGLLESRERRPPES